MTPDGISKMDWDVIHEIAVKIANAAMKDDDELMVVENTAILRALDRLQKKYGDKTSILATKADYLDDNDERVALYEKAYALAERNNDAMNKTSIASSLAELYWENLRDPKNAKIWLEKLNLCLREHPDKYDQEVYEKLRREI
jgi:hypothetical protein